MRLTSPGLFAIASVATLALSGCGLLTGPSDGEVADMLGTWTLTGTQSAPALDFAGTLTITAQRGSEIVGTASWEERDGSGSIRLDGGPISGLVLTASDVDFDITLLSGERRMIGRLSADTLTGAWAQPSASSNGGFRAVRRSPL